MTNEPQSLPSGDLLADGTELSLQEFCRLCRVSTDTITTFVAEGVIEPLGAEPAQWRFEVTAVQRVRQAMRLERDLGVNPAGAALALDLIEELEALRARLRYIDGR